MTRGQQSPHSKPGLTLLEIVMVLVIGAMILGGVATVITFSSDEAAIKKATRELESLAKRARATATLKQVPYALEFTPGMVRMMPWAEAVGDDRLAAERMEREQWEDGPAPDAVRWELSLDNGMQSRLRRWGSEEWVEMSQGQRELWRFDPNGICEPLTVELWLEEGRMSMEFNPLTAAISDNIYQYTE
ncbi:MAG: prepilin-type N-terminal cleavage/methylation domain-containing protein [Akkermansiaceae bacterium]|nr:prepilin-type N-terminal cleavage/methylation domain-containing protein [Akkermansiaceae bacterium]